MDDPVNRERFLHLVLSLVGQRVNLTQDNGTVLEGVFHTFTPFQNLPSDKSNRYVVKAVQVIEGDTEKIQNGSTVVIPAEKVLLLSCKSLRLGTANGTGNGFRTDTEISTAQNEKGRDLVAAGSAWTAPATAKVRADALMGESGPRKPAFSNSQGLKGQIGEWDQFKANEELFNVQAKFDENLYTTELDKSNMDKTQIKAAERMAREIENTSSANIHVAEERNQVIQGDFDEEDRYSGVLTSKLEARIKDETTPKMNYAAAAAKADKTPPPGFNGDKKDAVDDPEKDQENILLASSEQDPEPLSEDQSKQEEKKSTEDDRKTLVGGQNPHSEGNDSKKDGKKAESPTTTVQKESVPEEPKKKPASKLNAGAKSFTFNPGAKSFTPSFSAPAPAPAAPEQQQIVDPNTGTPVGVPPHMTGHPQYMHPMGQPGKPFRYVCVSS